MNENLNDILLSILELDIDISGLNSAKRELKRILTSYDFDKEFIDTINEDTIKGFVSAVHIVKNIIHSKQKEINDV